MAEAKKEKPEFVVGVDFGGTKILAAVLSPEGSIVGREKMRTRAERDASEVLQRIATCVEKAVESAGVPRDRIIAVGVGAPGPLNPDTGVIEAPPNFPGWKEIPLKTILEKHLDLRVHVENDVNAGTYGEYRMGAGIGVRDLVGIFIGTGIGGGLILNGRLYTGFNRTAGEVGHITLVPNGPKCGCGNLGCYEALAGRRAVVQRIHDLVAEGKAKGSSVLETVGGDLSAVRSNHLAEGWKTGDKATVTALTEMAEYTGIVIADIINFLNPELFVLGGGVIEALGAELVPLIDKAARLHAMPSTSRNVAIRRAMLGDDAVVIGAALLAHERSAPEHGSKGA